MEPVLTEKYFDVSSDEALSITFPDAAALFFRDDGMIAASRAPAGMLRPGKNLTDYVRDYSAAPPGGAPPRGRLSDAFLSDRAELSEGKASADAMSRFGLSGRVFFRAVPGMNELQLAVFPLSGGGVYGAVPSLEALGGIVGRAELISSATLGSELFCRVAYATADIARFAGAGVSFSDFCTNYICGDGFDPSAFIAFTLGVAMLFRRTARSRSFRLTLDSASDAPDSRQNWFAEQLKAPMLRFDAVLAEEMRGDELPELQALGRIAGMRGVPFECYRTRPADGSGEKLSICVILVRSDYGALGFKTLPPDHGDTGASAFAQSDDEIPGIRSDPFDDGIC